tara:strand:+ start:697 stop:906 length:210 start_codon:yes stop_codon:yes gene_type:complete
MNFDAKIKTLGFKDMHEDQADALLQVINMALALAANEGDEVFEEMHQAAEDAVILFGGEGIQVRFKASY